MFSSYPSRGTSSALDVLPGSQTAPDQSPEGHLFEVHLLDFCVSMMECQHLIDVFAAFHGVLARRDLITQQKFTNINNRLIFTLISTTN